MSTFIVRIDESKQSDGSVDVRATATPVDLWDYGTYEPCGDDYVENDTRSWPESTSEETAESLRTAKGCAAGRAVAKALEGTNG